MITVHLIEMVKGIRVGKLTALNLSKPLQSYYYNYPLNTIQLTHKPSTKNTTQKNKWTTFTYFGHEIRSVTKLFKNTEVGISYKTRNNIKHLLKINDDKEDLYNLSGVYQLQCADCPLKYIGQTGPTFKVRFKEHI
jgi:hypothetical protein